VAKTVFNESMIAAIKCLRETQNLV